MAQYIDKSALVAEIERLKKWEPIRVPQDNRRKEIQAARIGVCQCLLSFLDALEVKEVDLEKELES